MVDADGTTIETTTEGTGTTTDASGCEVNDTCTTQSTNFTVPQNLSGAQKPARPALKTRRVYEYCTCNLQASICDMNCCCDVDCTYEDRQVFSSCEDEVLTYDTRYCSYTKYLYINNTPFRWDVNQNGAFCVLKRNSPPQRIGQRNEPLRSVNEVEPSIKTKFSWSQYTRLKKETPLNLTNESFHYGTPIWIVSHGKLKKLQLVNRFLTDRCLIQEDVVNLKSKVYECVQTDVSESNELLSLRTYFQGLFVLNLTRPVNLTGYQRQNFQGCPRNVCLPIDPLICDDTLTECSPVSPEDPATKATCNLSKTTTTCSNLVKKLTYNFNHNGSAGYTKIEALAVLGNFAWDSAPSYLQQVSVNFIWNGTQRNLTNQLSGNPGYKVGKPVLVGMREERNGSGWRVVRNENVSVLVLPGNILEKCSSNGFPVSFGYNTLTRCKVQSMIVPHKRLMVKNKKNVEVVNGTEACRGIQSNVLHIWGIDNGTFDNLLLGMFGNADTNNLDDWIKAFSPNSPRGSTGRINEGTLACSNLINTLKIDIYHAKVDFEHILNQEKILGVQYRFEYVNESFPYDPKSNRVRFEMDLTSQVVFYDITGPKVKRYVDAPTLKITLPYDFFYPFVRIDNAAVKLTQVGYKWVLVGVFVIIVV